MAAVDGDRDPAARVLVRDHGLSWTEAARQLHVQDRADGLYDAAAEVAGTAFAGMWFDPDDRGRVHIALVSDRADVLRPKIQRLLSDRDLIDDAVIASARFGWQELVDAQSTLDQKVDDLIRRGLATTSIDTAGNRLVIDTAAGLADQDADLVSSAAKASPVEVNVRTEAKASVGISPYARSRSDGKLFVLTAGYCLYNDAETWKTRDALGGLYDIGIRHSWSYGSGGDMGIVRNWIAFWAGPPVPIAAILIPSSSFTAYNDNYGIGSAQTSAVGQAVCGVSGYLLISNEYASCGTVQSLNQTALVGSVIVGGVAAPCSRTTSLSGPSWRSDVLV